MVIGIPTEFSGSSGSLSEWERVGEGVFMMLVMFVVTAFLIGFVFTASEPVGPSMGNAIVMVLGFLLVGWYFAWKWVFSLIGWSGAGD